jgi:hypothetical protein
MQVLGGFLIWIIVFEIQDIFIKIACEWSIQSAPRTFSYNLGKEVANSVFYMSLYFPYVYVVNYEKTLGENYIRIFPVPQLQAEQ